MLSYEALVKSGVLSTHCRINNGADRSKTLPNDFGLDFSLPCKECDKFVHITRFHLIHVYRIKFESSEMILRVIFERVCVRYA